MNRRELLSLCGRAGLILPYWRLSYGAGKGKADGRDLVGTPAKRAEYLKRMLQVLCTEIGPRPAGSEGCERGALIIKREMERSLPAVLLDTFTFKRWVRVGESEFQVADRPLETYIAENSPGTPRDGVHGVLRKSTGGSARYEIVDVQSGRVGARVGMSEYGRAIAMLDQGQDGIPLFSIGKQDVGVLDKAVLERLPVRARGQVRWIPNVKTSNVAGTLPGASKDEILFVAHADTKYNTAGANDNTASMIAVLMLAHAMSGSHPQRTVTFLATTAEEIAFLGAENYARTRKEKGTLGDIKVCVNLDSLTYGPNLQITTTDSALERMILDIHRDLEIRSEPKVNHGDDTMDSAPFRAGGARTVHLNSRGDDQRTLPLWHRPEDRAETVNPEFIESSFRILRELTERLQTVAW